LLTFPQNLFPKTRVFTVLKNIVKNGTIKVQKETNSMRPISKSGFLLGALLAAMAAAIKIIFLDEIEERRIARSA
jgi:hypothetical protein